MNRCTISLAPYVSASISVCDKEALQVYTPICRKTRGNVALRMHACSWNVFLIKRPCISLNSSVGTKSGCAFLVAVLFLPCFVLLGKGVTTMHTNLHIITACSLNALVLSVLYIIHLAHSFLESSGLRDRVTKDGRCIAETRFLAAPV